MRRGRALVAMIMLAPLGACSLVRSFDGFDVADAGAAADDDAARTLDAAGAADSGDEGGGGDASVNDARTDAATCAHTACWTFDEADASTNGVPGLGIADGGVGDSRCLEVAVQAGDVAELALKPAPPVPSPLRHLHFECHVRVDEVAEQIDGAPYPAEETVCQAAAGSDFVGFITVMRAPTPQVRVTVLGGADAGVGKLCGDTVASSPAGTWTTASFDVDVVDGGVRVEQRAGGKVDTCPDVSMMLPTTLTLKAGALGDVHSRSPPGWRFAVDDVLLDLE